MKGWCGRHEVVWGKGGLDMAVGMETGWRMT